LDDGCFHASLNAVSLPATRGNKIAPQFFANVEYVHVHEIRECVITFIEEVFVKFRARDELAAVQRQVFEDGVFAAVNIAAGLFRVTDGARSGRLRLAHLSAERRISTQARESSRSNGFDQIIVAAVFNHARGLWGYAAVSMKREFVSVCGGGPALPIRPAAAA
jgi:hypothetical protein